MTDFPCQTDLFSFHEAHFGGAALAAFARDFLGPGEDDQYEADGEYYEYYEDEQDDGLGYYPDGVKRTLTDEQIAIFRHSELRALQKAQEESQERVQRRRNTSSPIPMDLEADSGEEEGELQNNRADAEGQMTSTKSTTIKKKKKNRKKKKRGSGNGSGSGNGNGGNSRWEPDPERRKRTWDVVETGLDALDYGEMDRLGASAERVSQRRRITYDDD